MTKIVTHDSGFHSDDAFAVATLLLLVGEAEIVRSRDPKDWATADYVVDVGMEYDVSKGRFDHHQPGGAGERENGIPYASFGLVWKSYGEKLSGGHKEAQIIDRKLVEPIDAHDNGIAVSEPKFVGVREYTIGDYLVSFLESREPEHLYKVFLNAVDIAKDLLQREIYLAKKYVASEEKILKIYDASEDKRLVVLTEELTNVRDVLSRTSDALYAIHPRPDGDWTLTTVPDREKSYGHVRQVLPLAWAGKEKEELQSITGVKDALFAHRGRFMASARTKEGAIALAKIALDS